MKLAAMSGLLLILSMLLVTAAGLEKNAYTGHSKNGNSHRKTREIRKDTRESRVLHYDTDESHDARKMLLLRNRPDEPLHDMYRKGFSHLHVPDFYHRQPLEERVPRRNIRNQTIDDIISGIIHLLGGDVHVTRPDTSPPSMTLPSTARPTRINDRGPAHFDMYSRRGRPPTTPTSSVSESSSVIENTKQSSSTDRWIFPDDTDVSRILGLINGTQTATESPASSSANLTTYLGVNNNNFIDSNNVSSGELEVVEIVHSAESGSHYTLPTSTTEKSLEASTTDSIPIRPTGVLTELDKNGHTFIETVIKNSAVNSTRSISILPSSSYTKHFETTSRPYINYTDLPILLPSRTTANPDIGKSKDSPVPSGPVTEWLPVGKPPVRTGNFTTTYTPKSDEPVIITHQPDNFEITVTRQMYTNESKSQPEVIPTYTSLMTPADVTSSADISVSIVATQVDVIYGRPSVSSVVPPPPPPSPSPTGRPQVYPVDIAEVRTSKRPSVFPRPRPPNVVLPTFKNGLRPLPDGRPSILRKPPYFRPQPPTLAPEIRIDTCVVGDDSTCDVQLKEHCRTERGVSACICRPGYGRTVERGPCSPVVSMLLTLKVAKLGDKSIDPTHFVPGSPEYQRLNYEASHAMSTVFTYSPLAEAFRGSIVNRIYFIANRMVINSTVHLDETEVRGSLRHHVEHAVATSISRRDNRLGTSQLFINGPLSALVEVEDLNECGDQNLNDCSEFALCDNLFGTFQCKCKPGYTDKFEGDPKNAGRICSACSPDYCNGKGQCVIVQGRQECRCRGNYGGSRCQVDNEVVGVSVGVSVVAIIVIAITAGCLYLWNRRWKRAHQKSQAAKHAGYRLQTMADHVRWGAPNTLGSSYVPSDSTMQLAPPPLSTSASQLYAISNIHNTRYAQPRNQHYEEDANPYGRIIRTLQKHNSLTYSGGLQYDTLNSECASSDEIGFPSVPSNSFVYHGTFPDRSNVYRT